MAHNKFTYNGTSNTEQVDLIDVFLQLWRGKKIIALTVFISILLSLSYIFFAKEKWISTAIITQPDAGQISSYTHALNIIYNDAGPRIPETQQALIERFNSAFSALSESLSNQDVPEELTIDSAVKEQALPLKLTYTAESAQLAQKNLAQYIQQVDDEVGKEVASDLSATIQSKKADLQQSLATQEKVVKEQKDLRIAQISLALTVAKNANIKTPQVQQTNQVSQDTMFMLGSDALSSLIKNEAARPLPFTDSYYKDRQSLFEVANLQVGDNGKNIQPGNLHSYRYVMKPTLPFRRDSPKRAIIILIAMFLGGGIGAGIVLVRNIANNYKK
ncbi:LPS O-antigen chain length determinant protein WzzB [Pluralibacter gergoviae]|uniref:LPS O-antigen chain length determinant protein WzzB n=1 Tax=Pluralibacter gergoviae TaxID=61647 RepID=UPI00330E68B7|nr:LPS O-antigen chain length determinant protein WzzB [Pluralibacter gergoviae]